MGLSEGAVYDSVILIDALNDRANMSARIGRDSDRKISVITRTEVMTGIHDDDVRLLATAMIQSCENIPVTNEIADLAAELRQQYRLKTADALIYATARILGVPLVTRDTGFPDEADVVKV
jgi:predicted nucleic acid-binding protein